jgi:hypothetical protein
VPNVKKLKDKILRKAHKSVYSIHPGGNKMYHDLKTTPSMLHFATLVNESKLSINDLLNYCSRCKCSSESEKRLP